MEALNRIYRASHHYWLTRYQLEQRQSLRNLSTQPISISAATRFTSHTNTANSNTSNNPYQGHQLHQQQQLSLPEPTNIQPIRTIASTPRDVASCKINYAHLHQAQPYGFMLQQVQLGLPRPTVPGPIVPTVTFDTTNTAGSTRHSSGTDPGLNVSSHLAWTTARPTQQSPLPPAPVPPVRPEQQDIHVAPSRVSNYPRLFILHIIVTYGDL
jgi:hypothetical protein